MICGCCRKLANSIFEKENVENKTPRSNSSKKASVAPDRKLFTIPEGGVLINHTMHQPIFH